MTQHIGRQGRSWGVWLYASVAMFACSMCFAASLSEPVSKTSIAPLQPETIYVQRLQQPSPHWLILNDPNFSGNMDSKIYVVDADRNHMLGMLSAGGWRNAVEYSPDFSTIYSPETYYTRTCLLYTSPSPRDAHESRMPSSA